MAQPFDVAVIGAGPGGYVAAIRCGQLGLNTACIDDWKNPEGKPSLGGTCLNVGCIPSKALLESSENYERAARKFAAHGITVNGLSMDVPVMISRKDKIVSNFTGGVAMLFRKNKVTPIHGHATLIGSENGDEDQGSPTWRIEVKDGGKLDTVQAKNVIIATGSVPRTLSFAPADNEWILDNTGALALKEVPKRLGVIGGGVIGLEMGSVWRRLGAEVTILEALPQFLMAADEQVAKEARKLFTRESGLNIKTGVKISEVKTTADGITVEYTDASSDGNVQKLTVDRLIVAVGRVPNTAGLGAENIGLKLDDRGFIEVDSGCRTSLPKIYAVGDVVRGPMLAHKASEEGVAVAETIAGQPGHANLETIPWVIYTSPEIAWVGKTEQELKTAGIQYKAGQFPFMANGRARALGETGGFVKMLTDAATDRILGVHMIGPYVSELIAEAVVAMEFGATSEDIARIVHAHPSLSEVVHEAALAVDKRAIHI
jgi:dihydrolipoamide dehydrogenase